MTPHRKYPTKSTGFSDFIATFATYCRILYNSCMGKVLAIVNQQGGVGKSTSSRHVAMTLAERGRRVLLVDFDPLSDTGTLLGVDGRNTGFVKCLEDSGGNVCCSPVHVQDSLDLLTSGKDLIGLELAIIGREGRERVLDSCLKAIKDSYEVVVIDTPSSLGLLTTNALVAADAALIPVRCNCFGQEGIAELMRTVGSVERTLNNRLNVLGFVATHVFRELRSSKLNIDDIRNNYGDMVFGSLIHKGEDLCIDYSELTDEILQCL